MLIPYLDLRTSNLAYQGQFLDATKEVLQSGQFIGGAFVEKFEAEFAQYTQSSYCVGTGNGLDALLLALMALGIAPGDEVIAPSHTYIATWLPITRLGATIVPAEPDMSSFHVAAHNIKPLITPKTKAIIPVHLYGMPCNMDAICALAQQHGIPVRNPVTAYDHDDHENEAHPEVPVLRGQRRQGDSRVGFLAA